MTRRRHILALPAALLLAFAAALAAPVDAPRKERILAELKKAMGPALEKELAALLKPLQPTLLAARTEEAFYGALNTALARSQKSHYQIIPPGFEGSRDSGGALDAGVGITLRVIGEDLVAARVEPESPAALAGIRPGHRIVLIDTALAVAVRQSLHAMDRRRRDQMMIRTFARRLAGPAGSKVRLEYMAADDELRRAELQRQRPIGERVKFGEMPAFYVQFEARRLEHAIGYLRFNYFMFPLMPKIRAQLQEFNDAPGIVLDLRNNPGGMAGMAIPVAALLSIKRGTLGTSKQRDMELNFPILPVANPYRGPLAILIDEGTGSTAEILAAGLQDNKRATIVGRRSMGAVLPSMIVRLASGARLQYPVADFQTPSGTHLEGRGVIPDITVKLDRKALLAGRDLSLENAVKHLAKRRSEKKP